MRSKIATLTLPLITASTLAAAEGTNYLSYGASYSNLSVNDTSFYLFTADAAIDFTANDFVFNGDVQFTDVDGQLNLTMVNFRGGYAVAPGTLVYAGVLFDDYDGNMLTFYNAGAEYAFGNVTLGLNLSRLDQDGADTYTTLYGSYQATDALELALFVENGDDTTTVFAGADFDMGDTDIAAFISDQEGYQIFAISGTYDFGNGFRAGGGFASFDGDLDVITLSGGYEVNDGLWVDAGLGRISDNFGTSVDTLGVSLTYETGRQSLLLDRGQTAQRDALGPIAATFANGGFD